MPKLNFENNSIEKNLNGTNTKNFYPAVKNLFSTSANRGGEWPEGHPDESEFRFCNKERFEDKGLKLIEKQFIPQQRSPNTIPVMNLIFKKQL